MFRRFLLLVAVAAFLVPVAAARADPGATAGASDAGAADGLARALRAVGLHAVRLPRIPVVEVDGASAATVRAALAGDPRLRWVEPLRARTLTADPAAGLDPDTGRPFDWAYDAVGAGAGLALAGGGSRVRVAVVDSGVDAGHPDLAGRLAPGIDVLRGGGDVTDEVGHGTFVAGLISAVDGNGIGGRGVAGDTTVIPVRVTSNGGITSADSAAGIVRAVDAGAGVINLSYGGPTLSSAESSALAYAQAHDVLVVAAAGNTGRSGDQAQYPAAAIGGVRGGWSSGVSVGATTPSGAPADFSTANDAVTMVAPGAGVRDCDDGLVSTIPAGPATLWDDPTMTCSRTLSLGDGGGRYGYGEGTSFATPLVAGAAALVRGVNPALSAPQTADVLRRSATRLAGVGWTPAGGAGLLDVGAAVALARRYDTTPPAPALSVRPSAGGVSVDLGGRDLAAQNDETAGVASYTLERSADGRAYAVVAGPQGTPIHLDDAPVAWYRGTVCDANHNCASAVSGPAARAASPAATRAPVVRRRARLRAPRLTRPGRCSRCLRLSVATSGSGRLRWSVAVGSRHAGVRVARRSGTIRAGRRLTVTLKLSRRPICGGSLAATVRLGSGRQAAHAGRVLRVRARCRTVAR